MKKATIDQNGLPTAFYDTGIHGKSIPKSAIEIPDADWQAHIDGDQRRWDGSAWVPHQDLAQVQAMRIGELEQDYQLALDAGVQYQGATFQSDARSISGLAEILTALANGWTLPAGFAWIDATNAAHPVPDVAWLQGLAAAFADHKSALYARLQTAKSAVRTAATVADVQAVTF